MSNLNFDLDYFEHPKIRRLVAILGEGAELLPIRLWCYAGKYHVQDGCFKHYSDREVECLAQWKGKEGEMIDAMLKICLLERDKEFLKIHGWEEQNGHLLAFKKRASRAAKARWGKLASNATSITKRAPKQSPYQPTIPTIPTEEKKRAARPGSVVDVLTFFEEKGSSQMEANKFWNHFESNGWKVGGRAPMKNWKSAATNWISRKWENGNGKKADSPKDQRPAVTAQHLARSVEIARGLQSRRRSDDRGEGRT